MEKKNSNLGAFKGLKNCILLYMETHFRLDGLLFDGTQVRSILKASKEANSVRV